MLKKFNVKEIQHSYQQRKQDRDGVILKLSQQGWTQQDIATQTGLTDRQIRNIGNKFNVKEISDSYQQGKPVEEIAEYHTCRGDH